MRLLFALCFFFLAISHASADFLPATAGYSAPLLNLASALTGGYSHVALYNVGTRNSPNLDAGFPGPITFNFVYLNSSRFLHGALFNLNPASCSDGTCVAGGGIVSPLSTQLLQVQGTSVGCPAGQAAMLNNWGGGDSVGTTVYGFCSPKTHIGANEVYYFLPVPIDGDNIVYQIRSWQHQSCLSPPSGYGSEFALQLKQCSALETTQQWALYGFP